MMGVPEIVWIIGGVAVFIMVALVLLLWVRARRVNLTRSESLDRKPVWMRTEPPPETVAATQADGEGVALYDDDEGERVAAPFAEQIEDILRARLREDPALADLEVDLGTAPDGSLEIWVDGERYPDVDLLPHERLRQAFRQAVERWEQGQEK